MSILLEGLCKQFATFTAVDDLTLEIADGELFVLLGPSGSGKSTVLRIIAGLVQPDAGGVRLHGRDVTHLPPQARNVGMVFQNYSLFRHMTVGRNIEFGLEVRRVAPAERTARRDQLLDLIGMTGLADRYPRQLSGGQMQRVAVARALAFEPSVLLLDEPFGALDVRIRGQLRRSLKRLQRHMGVTTIVVTHDQEEAFELADRIGVVDHGRLLEVGTPETLYRRPTTEFVARFLGNAILLNGRMHGGRVRMGSLELTTSEAPGAPAGRSTDEAGASPTARAGTGDLVAVMLRPEDLAVATDRAALGVPALGRARIGAIEFRGALTRVEADLEPPPGVRALDASFGDASIPLELAMLPTEVAGQAVTTGLTAWIGMRGFHVLPRSARYLQLCVHPGFDATVLAGAVRLLSNMENLDVHVLALGPTEAQARRQLELARRLVPPGRTWELEWAASDDWIAAALALVPHRAYDLIVTHADSPATAERTARQAPIPVLLLRGGRPSVRRALLCTAAGEPGKVDVLVGAKVVRRLGAKATVLYVARRGAPASDIVQRHLALCASTLHGQGIDCDTKVRSGDVVAEILAEATEGDYDLVVLGGHIPSGRAAFGGRDVASAVARESERSVLVVRGPMG